MRHITPSLFALGFVLGLFACAPAAHATDAVASFGMSAEDSRHVRPVTLLSMRQLLGDAFNSELTLEHSDRSRDGWPTAFTASVIRRERHGLYAGAGVGVHRLISPVRSDAGGLRNEPFRVAAGFQMQTGLVMPFTFDIGLDLNARYSFYGRRDLEAPVPDRFASHYWTVTLGLIFQP